MSYTPCKKIHATARLFCVILLLCCTHGAARKRDTVENWQVREALISRLSAEWYKIGLLRKDLAGARDILTDLRSFELFPAKVTGLTDEKVVILDEGIEDQEKRQDELVERLAAMRPPLSDALAILREMVVGQPIEDMFEVIEDGDLKRLAELLDIKHEIDGLWANIDDLIVWIDREMGLMPFAVKSHGGIEEVFFDIIRANLGQQHEQYYEKMSTIKDSLALRATDDEIRQIYAIESQQVKTYLSQDKNDLALRKLLAMRRRLADRLPLDETNLLLTRAYFALGEYASAAEAAVLLPSDSSFAADKTLYTIQSWYAMQEHSRVWEWAKVYDFSRLSGRQRNLALWITMESGLTLGVEAEYSELAGQMNKGRTYTGHILHALARSYIAANQLSLAVSVLKSALQIRPTGEIDEDARLRILLAHAQTLFELKQPRQSLEVFFELLNTREYFEEALFGIAWCYISLDKYRKAETTLRKLINQNPESPRAAEAVLLMAKRYVSKAQYEWKKLTYLDHEGERLQRYLNKIGSLPESERDSLQTERIHAARAEIRGMLDRIKQEPRFDKKEIGSYYGRALRICDLVASHYETGTFQEVSFSQRREKLLHRLDSITLAIKEERQAQNTPQARTRENLQRVKSIVRQSSLLAVEIQIDIFRWQREYIEWQKMKACEMEKIMIARCAQVEDSLELAHCATQREEFADKIDSLVAQGDHLHEYWTDSLTTLCKRSLESALDRNDEIYFRYHLAELLYAQENAIYARAYDDHEETASKYDSLLSLFHKGKLRGMPMEPARPELDHSQSMREYRTAIRKFPDHALCSAHRYGLAWCFNDLGLFDSAVAQMAALATDFPESRYAPQAWMYLGEYRFDNAKLADAIDAYRSVMKYSDSKWFDEALYKLAWTQYRLANPEKAISTFLALVDLGESEGMGKSLLEEESLDYIAISFSESDPTGRKGLDRATAFVRRFGDPKKGTRILHRLGQVYQEQGRFTLARETFEALLEMYPSYRNSPAVDAQLIAVKEPELPLSEVSALKIVFAEKYNRGSDWARSQTDSATVAQADSTACHLLYDASISFHQAALQENDSASYARAASAYRDYVRLYPEAPNTNECHYNLAEILFLVGNYYLAAEEYMAVSRRYPNSKYRETAAWNAIVASQNLLKQEGNALE